MMKCLWILRTLLCAAYIIILSVVMSSCEHLEPIGFAASPVEFDVEGISLIKENKYSSFGEIPSDGCHFIIHGKGKNASQTFIRYLYVNDVLQYDIVETGRYDPTTLETINEISGDCWRINYLSNNPPYVMEVRIAPNMDNTDRIFLFELGRGCPYTTIKLTQPAE